MIKTGDRLYKVDFDENMYHTLVERIVICVEKQTICVADPHTGRLTTDLLNLKGWFLTPAEALQDGLKKLDEREEAYRKRCEYTRKQLRKTFESFGVYSCLGCGKMMDEYTIELENCKEHGIRICKACMEAFKGGK